MLWVFIRNFSKNNIKVPEFEIIRSSNQGHPVSKSKNSFAEVLKQFFYEVPKSGTTRPDVYKTLRISKVFQKDTETTKLI